MSPASPASAFDAWLELNQAGRLLDRESFDDLPDPGAPPPALADKLRDALTAADLPNLLAVVLEEACGLRTGWRKNLGAAETERLLDGTELKPRWLYAPSGETRLAVFVTAADRIGLHKGRRAFTHVVEYLRRRKLSLGFITNGREWRLVFADPDNQAWVEWLAERWLEGDTLTPAMALLQRVLSIASLASPLLEAIRKTRRGQAKLSEERSTRTRPS